MKLGFEESQATYASESQNARALTEAWATNSLFCPACGFSKLVKFPNNRPAADLYCSSCSEEFELKSQKANFGKKVLDGAYRTLTERLAAANNPNFFFLNYDRQALSVQNLFVIPKHFFVPMIIERRKPLAATARRAGWTGCNILLERIPKAGKIFIVKSGEAISKDSVIKQWQRTLFLRDEKVSAKGWLLEVMNCVDNLSKREFSLDEIYSFESHLSALYPNNQNVRPKMRQQLQKLRDQGYLEFVSRGKYRLLSD